MKKFNRFLMWLLLLCLVPLSLAGCVPKSDFEALQADYELLQSENTGLETLVEHNTEDIEEKEELIEDIQNELESIKDELSSTQQELDSAEKQYRDTLNEIESYKVEMRSYLEELQLYKDTFGSVVQSGGRVPFYRIYLRNNDAAVDPTLAEVRSFMREDITDQNDYITDVYMCGDFANDVHNNAEKAGIRAAFVAILIESDDGSTSYHACNAFKTTDEGLIFIDCTGRQAGERTPPRSDRIVNVRLDSMYKPRFLFAPRWRSGSMGIIRDIQVYW